MNSRGNYEFQSKNHNQKFEFWQKFKNSENFETYQIKPMDMIGCGE